MRRGRTILTAVGVAAAAAAVVWLTAGNSAPDGSPSSAPSEARRASLAPAAAQQAGGSQAAGQDTAAAADTTAAGRAITAHRTAQQGPEQPIPFSHAFHVTDLQIQCEYCHTGSRNQQVATMPQMGVCMGCHNRVGGGLQPIEQMRKIWSADRAVEWERVYKLPEFVQFSHQAHLRNQIECQECHGTVEEMDRIYQATPMTMGWCLECHRGEPQPADTATTYRLVRQYEIPEIPAGRQSLGLYPRQIKQSYGVSRAPVDCAACHY